MTGAAPGPTERPRRVDEFVEAALYDPDRGFYESGGRAGRRGASFLTSPEVGPLFGAVVAAALDDWWEAAGRPERWVVVDAGSGPGTLARSILAAAPRCATALELVCVERTAAQRALHPSGVTSRADLPAVADVIVANELLDNLPFGMLEDLPGRGWAEVAVLPDGSTTPDLGGRRIPLVAAAATWIDEARSRLRPGGHLVCIDYAATTAELADRPWTEWVRGFADQERVDPFTTPGSRDITVVVPHDQLPAADLVTTQADWLQDHGIAELVRAGVEHWQEHAAAPDLTAMRMRSRVSEAEALLDPGGLGAFWVAEWSSPHHSTSHPHP